MREEEFQIKNNSQINEAIKSHSLAQLKKQNIIIPEHKDKVNRFWPILKALRQSMNDCPDFSSKKHLEESFSFAGTDANFETNTLEALEIYKAVK